MIAAFAALSAIPAGLRKALLDEYQAIVQNFMEHRWLPSELSGGRFSEIVFTIVDGHAKGVYASVPSKPRDFVGACRKLENNSHEPRSFQILIPRVLPALYEIRNNRNVGHVGGDVDPNHMDSVAVLAMCNWIMGELVRVYHGLSITEAQRVVDALSEIRMPAVWSDGKTKRVLLPELKLPDQLLLLIATSVPSVSSAELAVWTECTNKKHFLSTLREFHRKRLIEFDESTDSIRILPPGTQKVEKLIHSKKIAQVI